MPDYIVGIDDDWMRKPPCTLAQGCLDLFADQSGGEVEETILKRGECHFRTFEGFICRPKTCVDAESFPIL